jgi:hypothetical protein
VADEIFTSGIQYGKMILSERRNWLFAKLASAPVNRISLMKFEAWRIMAARMFITFLGTAAANAFPEAFCNCRNCAQARMSGGRSLRKRSAAVINDDLLIDLGPDIMAASQIHLRPLHQVRYCLQTHPHADHLDL